MSTIITIVEGQGEVFAVPILIRRIAAAVEPSVAPQVPKPIRVKRHRFLKENELERYVDLAARQAGPDGCILIILDADDDCPPERASEVLQRATAVRSDCRIRVVLAQREYEAWFLVPLHSSFDCFRRPERGWEKSVWGRHGPVSCGHGVCRTTT